MKNLDFGRTEKKVERTKAIIRPYSCKECLHRKGSEACKGCPYKTLERKQ